jgi:DNA repair photolyase
MLISEFARFSKKETTPQLLNTGELGDSLAMEENWYHGAGPFSRFVIEMFRKQTLHKVLFLTKVSIIQNILEAPPTDQVIISFSFNAPSVVEKCGEPNNLSWRIQSSIALQKAGWHVRGRIDPIIPELLEDYEQLIPKLAHLERITLGSLRINNRQLPRTYPSFWNAFLPKMRKVNANCYRFPEEDDTAAFRQIIEWLEEAGFRGELALCKEPLDVWKSLGLADYKNPKCNCVL